MDNHPLVFTIRRTLIACAAGDDSPIFRGVLPGFALLILGLAGAGVQALELGRPQTLSGLGQPLLLKIPVRLDPGETLRSDCIQVAVQAGERDIAPSLVTKTVEWQVDKGAATVWVRTAELIDEPVVKLSLGCPKQQLTALLDPAADGQAASSLSLPHAASASASATSVASLLKKGHTGGLARPEKSATPDKSDKKPQARSLPITLPDAELAGLRWRFDSDLGHSAHSKTHIAAMQKKTTSSTSAVSLLMSIDVAPPVVEVRPAALDSERVERARLQFADLQRQQQTFGAEIDQLLAEGAQQESEQSKFMVIAVGVAAALLLLVLGSLLRAKLSQRKRVVAAG